MVAQLKKTRGGKDSWCTNWCADVEATETTEDGKIPTTAEHWLEAVSKPRHWADGRTLKSLAEALSSLSFSSPLPCMHPCRRSDLHLLSALEVARSQLLMVMPPSRPSCRGYSIALLHAPKRWRGTLTSLTSFHCRTSTHFSSVLGVHDDGTPDAAYLCLSFFCGSTFVEPQRRASSPPPLLMASGTFFSSAIRLFLLPFGPQSTGWRFPSKAALPPAVDSGLRPTPPRNDIRPLVGASQVVGN